jgi:hypothetical protein
MEEMNVTYYYKENTCVYYSYESQLYHPLFPIDWARNHKPNTGPFQCEDCRENRSWNGIFFGYCDQCLSQYEINSSMITISKQYYDAVKELGFTPIKDELDNPINEVEIKDAMEIDIESLDGAESNETDYHAWETSSECEDDDADSITIEYGYGSNYNGGYDSY